MEKRSKNSNCSPFPRACKTTTLSLSLNKDTVTENQSYITEGIPWNSSQKFISMPASGNQSSKLGVSVPLAMFGERLQERVFKESELSLESCKNCLQQMPWRWICFIPEARICWHKTNRIVASKPTPAVCVLWFPVGIPQDWGADTASPESKRVVQMCS